jgi:hypothetical protein
MDIGIAGDDEWRRRGLAHAVEELGGLLRVAWSVPLADVRACEHADVLLLAGDTGGRDRLGGLSHVAALRLPARTLGLAIGLVDGDSLNDVSRLRAATSGLDQLHAWSELQHVEDLERAILAPDDGRSPYRTIDEAVLRSYGLSLSSNLAAGLVLLGEDPLGAFDPAVPHPLTRRQRLTLRARFAGATSMRSSEPGSAASIDRTTPTWRQLSRVVHLACGRRC